MTTQGAKASTNAAKKKSAKNRVSATKKGAKTAKKSETLTKKSAAATKKNAQSQKNKEKNAPENDELRRMRLIKNETRRLGDTFKEIDSEKRRLVKATIDDAAFLTVSMQELRDQINREGMEVEYQNGANQWGTKQSPAVVSYLAMSQKLAAAMKILLECMPKTDAKTEISDKFDDFVVERGDD